MKKRLTEKQAFTLIEFMLAMTFLSVMLVAIGTLTVRIVNIYQKGLSVRAVNTVGSEIIQSMESDIGASFVIPNTINPKLTGPTDVEVSHISEARENYYHAFYHKETGDGGEILTQSSGIFCTPSYAYIWNTADTIRELREAIATDGTLGTMQGGKVGVSGMSVETTNKLLGVSTDRLTTHSFIAVAVDANSSDTFANNDFVAYPKLARIRNSSTNSLCSQNDDTAIDNSWALSSAEENSFLPNLFPAYNGSSSDTGILVDADDYVELINDESDDSDLALYDFVVHPAYQATQTGHVLYDFSFILGTVSGGININTTGDYCTGKSEENGNLDADYDFSMSGFEYCALNKFDFTAMQTGEASSL